MDITLLCKVIDNYGDIGFVYRLLMALREVRSEYTFRLILNDFSALSFIAPDLSTDFKNLLIFDWNDESGRLNFIEKPAECILECFECGRPAWLDELLFSSNTKKIVTILNVEYLTAEDWAEDFHLLKSGTRSALVKKYNFMPGFTKKTGGLVLGKNFLRLVQERRTLAKRAAGAFRILFFSYPSDIKKELCALERFDASLKMQGKAGIEVLLAQGSGREPFLDSYAALSLSFAFSTLPYLAQKEWDSVIASVDFAFVRGEDSFSRAALLGIPFLWQAYRQEGDFQLVKVAALLKKMEPFFIQPKAEEKREYFSLIERCFLLYNSTLDKAFMCSEAADVLKAYSGSIKDECGIEEALFLYLCMAEKDASAFAAWSQSLIQNGDAALHIVEFLESVSVT